MSLPRSNNLADAAIQRLGHEIARTISQFSGMNDYLKGLETSQDPGRMGHIKEWISIYEDLEAVKTKIQELKEGNGGEERESMKSGEDEEALERTILLSRREREDDEDSDDGPSTKRIRLE